MPRRRFYASPDEITGSIVTLSTHETHHLVHVLRMTPGDEAFVTDGCGREYRCTFRRIEGNRAHLDIDETLSDVVESPLQITLAQALAKGEKFDFIIQKATELGVSAIVPLMTRYADVRLDDQQKLTRLQRWRRISLEAMKQCGRRKLVEITTPRTLREFIAECVPPSSGISAVSADNQQELWLFCELGGASVTDALGKMSARGRVSALIGPEGGWSDDELDALREGGCRAVNLGPRVLRTETAAIVAITLIQHAIGDLSTPPVE
jgi:16S rRNA (uracil1498-N3)-methyltransferase